MSAGRKSHREQATRKLLELWEPAELFGKAIGCVASTYTFDAPFFEEECLGRFAGVQSDPAENDRIYMIEREVKLSECFAAVIVDQAHVPTHRSLRWHVLAARVPRGIQHAKLSLLVWAHRIRLLIGSANLTKPGYRANYENIAVFEFGPEPDENQPPELLEQTLAFVEQLALLAPGAESVDGPQAELKRFLKGVRKQIRAWPRSRWNRRSPHAVLVPVVPNGATIFDQLREAAPSATFHRAWVQSPFFDDGEGVKRVVTALGRLLAQRSDRTIDFAAPGYRLPNGRIEYAAPSILRKPFLRRTRHNFTFVDRYEHEPDGRASDRVRHLHAKSIWLERDGSALYCLGSSNFTCAGTGLAKHGGNYELNVAYVIPDLRAEFGRICREAFPPQTHIDLDRDDVHFTADAKDRTSDGTELNCLPMSFGEATFDPFPRSMLRCELGPDAPEEFAIKHSRTEMVLDATAWRIAGSPAVIRLPWSSQRPPSHLYVRWESDSAVRESIWPVNVVDTSRLPPADELRSLTLEELLQILTSASPPHEVLSRIIKRRTASGRTRPGRELDPHRRVDTRGFLLQRMRRFALALEGLRERLERPVYSREGLNWRLFGPFGVMTLAQRLVDEEGEGAAFMISELACTSAAISIPANGELTTKEISSTIAKLIEDLRMLAETHRSPPSVEAYVTRTFVRLTS